MTPDIPTALTIVGAAATVVGPTARELITRVAGPAADEMGLWLRERLQDWRRGNAAAVAERAAAMLSAAGAEASPVPLRFLLPAFEAASLEDQTSMQERWAALLANAALGATATPLYSHMLSQMSPVDAEVLSACGKIDRTVLFAPRSQQETGYIVTRRKLLDSAGITDRRQLEHSLDALTAQHCLDPEPALYPVSPAGDDRVLDFGMRMTELGRGFLAAVSPPEARSAAG